MCEVDNLWVNYGNTHLLLQIRINTTHLKDLSFLDGCTNISGWIPLSKLLFFVQSQGIRPLVINKQSKCKKTLSIIFLPINPLEC